jgi:hypothetical protein
MLRVEKVILVGLTPVAIETFRRIQPGLKLITIDSVDEWDGVLPNIGIPIPHDATICSPDEVMWGLLLAKKLGHRLQVVSGSASIKGRVEGDRASGRHCIMVDDMEGVIPVIVANYAFAIGADVRSLPRVEFDEIDSIYDGIQERANKADPNRRSRAGAYIDRQGARFASGIDTRGFAFITFVTRGVPYGYFLPHLPSTHLYSYLDLGRHVADSIYYSSIVRDTRLALVVDPGFFADSESTDVTASLRARRIKVKELRGATATRRNVEHYIRYYPYDLLYICTHAGELREGKRLTVEFATADGRRHFLVVDVTHTFVPSEASPGEEPKIEVMKFTRFVELDGVAWTDDHGKERIGAGEIIKEFTDLQEKDWKVAHSQDTDTIRDFPVIEATDGPISLVSEYFGGGGLARPIIFNNACSSLHNLSTWCVIAGVRGYIGTLATVEDRVAKEVGLVFFRSLIDEVSLPVLLQKVQDRLIPNAQNRVYVHFGCHFNTIRRPRRDVSRYPQAALLREIDAWREYLAGNHPEKFKQAVRGILLFAERALREER